MPRPWSKYSEGASAHAKAKAMEAAEKAEPPAKVSVREEKKKRKLKHGVPEGAQGLKAQVTAGLGLVHWSLIASNDQSMTCILVFEGEKFRSPPTCYGLIYTC